MSLCKSRLRLRHPIPQRTPHAVVSDARPDLAWLDKVTSNRYTCPVACLVAQCHVGSTFQRMRGEKARGEPDLEC